MTDEKDSSRDENNSSRDETGSSRDEKESFSGGLLDAVRLIVDSVVDAERENRSTFGGTGRIPGGHFTTEYGFSGQIGGPQSSSNSKSDSRSSDSHSPDSRPTQRGDDPYLVDVRKADNELQVVADLPDIEVGDITTGVDEARGELVIGIEGQTAERVSLPWSVTDVEAQFNHGVLELTLTRLTDERDEENETEVESETEVEDETEERDEEDEPGEGSEP